MATNSSVSESDDSDSIKLKLLLRFFPDFWSYLRYRGRQTRVWTFLIFEFFVIVFNNFKREIVKRMFWGRNSFYRQAFHFIVVSITLVTFTYGVAGRVVSEANTSQGLNVAQGQLGASDIIQQYQTAKSFAVRAGDSLPFDLIEHDVQGGETLESIAELYNLSNPQSIQWANGMEPYDTDLRVGQNLLIPPMDGVLKEAKVDDTPKTIIKGVVGANEFDVVELNDLDAIDQVIAQGTIVFIPGVIPISSPGGGVAPGGAPAIVQFPNPGIDVPDGTFINPLGDPSCAGYKFVRGWSTYHTGIDLAKGGGCWIRSAGPGVVSKVRWCGSLGFCTIVKHADGISTIYGHGNGKFAVTEGEVVQAGQKIMYMGCTGRCYGTHLHFSMAANNNDPLNCYTCRVNPYGIVPY